MFYCTAVCATVIDNLKQTAQCKEASVKKTADTWMSTPSAQDQVALVQKLHERATSASVDW